MRHYTFQISVKANYSSIIMPFCGPKLSLCGVILSAWGIVQLVSDEILKLIFEFFMNYHTKHIVNFTDIFWVFSIIDHNYKFNGK